MRIAPQICAQRGQDDQTRTDHRTLLDRLDRACQNSLGENPTQRGHLVAVPSASTQSQPCHRALSVAPAWRLALDCLRSDKTKRQDFAQKGTSVSPHSGVRDVCPANCRGAGGESMAATAFFVPPLPESAIYRWPDTRTHRHSLPLESAYATDVRVPESKLGTDAAHPCAGSSADLRLVTHLLPTSNSKGPGFHNPPASSHGGLCCIVGISSVVNEGGNVYDKKSCLLAMLSNRSSLSHIYIPSKKLNALKIVKCITPPLV